MPTIPLRGSATVQLDALGGGQAPAGPTLPGTSWNVTGVAVSVATNASESVCQVFTGAAGPFPVGAAQLLGATSTGSTGDSFGPAITIWPGQQLVAAWLLGDPGAVATIAYWGTQDVP